jgi:hypothetical protein
MPIRSESDVFGIVPAGENGLVLYRLFGGRTKNQLEVIHADTLFQVKWRGFIPVDPTLVLSRHQYNGHTVSFLFQAGSWKTSGFTLLEVRVNDGRYSEYQIRNVIPFQPTHFLTTAHGALIGGYLVQIPLVVFFDKETLQSRILPGLFNEPGELTQIKVNADDSFDVLIGSKNLRRQQTLWIKNYDARGNLERNQMLDPGEDYSLLFGRAVETAGREKIIAGVYGNRNRDFSRGIFVARIDQEGNQQLRYYNYGDLRNFFQYMKARREQRIKERIARKKIKGKKIKFAYRLQVHELIPYQGNYVMLGEAFYPRYKSVQSYGRSMYGPGPSQTLVFDGYQYTHAVVLGIDQKGDLLWDNSFQINDVRTFVLEQYVKIATGPDYLALLYLYKNEIRSKVIRNEAVAEGQVIQQVNDEWNQADDPRVTIEVSKLDYWYGSTFYAYGIKTVGRKDGQGKQRLFYISKVRYR